MESPAIRLAVIFHRLGPYHWARLTAAARRFELTVIEQAAETAEYAWDQVGGESGFARRTLFASDEPDTLQQTAMAARTHAALDAAQPQAIAIPGWSNRGGLAALGWALRKGVPAVIMSESTAGDRRRAWWKELPKKRVIGLGSAALAGGTPHRRYLEELGMAANRIFLGYDAVDNDHFRDGADAARRDPAARARLGLPPRYFLASNRFLPQKNLLALLAAFAAYRTEAGPAAWDLVLLGDGPCKPEIQARLRSLDLGAHVTLPGFQQYAALPAYYGLAEAFVHTATSEPWGLVVNEAMAAGLPVIVSERCGCAPDLVENATNGWIFDPAHPTALAVHLRTVAGLSTAQRETMGRASQERIAHWSVERFAGGMAGAVHAALKAPRPRPGLLDRMILRSLAEIHRPERKRPASHEHPVPPAHLPAVSLPMFSETAFPKKVLMVVPALSMIYGGPSLTSIGLARALCIQGVEMDVATTNADSKGSLDVPLHQWVEADQYRVRYFPRWGSWEYKFSPSLANWLWHNVTRYDIVHTTSVFNFPVLAAAAICEARKVPYVINVQGMLEPWALAYKAWKKYAYYRLFERPRLQNAAAIHCLTQPEAENIAALGIRSPLVIVPNGINPAQVTAVGDPEVFYGRYPELRGKTLLLFLHRVDRKKGLDLLARAFASVLVRLPDLPLHLVVAGPPTGDFLPEARGFFQTAGCSERVTFTGMLSGADKDAAFAAATVFVTPTYSEGFSMAVLEAMAAGLPGVMTTGCNFPEAGQTGAAKVTPVQSEPFADALVELLRDPQEMRAMGKRARQLVLDDYTWEQAAHRTTRIYTAIMRREILPHQAVIPLKKPGAAAVPA